MSIDALVLQGGGCRCFFTLGFLEAAAPALSTVSVIAAVSASSAMACAHVVGVHRPALEGFARLVRDNPRNFYPGRLWRRGQSVMPHYGMYRKALFETLLTHDPELLLLRKGPRVRVLLGAGPTASRTLAVGLAALSVLRARTPKALRPKILELGQLTNLDEVIAAVLASSAFPPFTPAVRIGKQAIIDGGAVEPIPLSALPEGVQEPLLVLTRPTPPRPVPEGIALVAPRSPLPVSTWDYANERAMRLVHEEGLRAGERFVKNGPDRRS